MKTRMLTTLATLIVLSVVTTASASTVTFGFAGNLFQLNGANGFSVGNTFTGTFSYSLQQQGVNVPLGIPGQETRYVLSGYTLTIQNQTITASGGRIDIGNDQRPFPSSPGIVWDNVELSMGTSAGTSLSCSLNGLAVTDLSLGLVSLTGQPFSDTSLPTNLPLQYFNSDVSSAEIGLTFSNNQGFNGTITSLQVVPEPGVVTFFGISALVAVGRIHFGRRNTTAPK